MKYWSDLEVKLLLEHLYTRQSAYVLPEKRSKSCLLKETSDLIIEMNEKSLDEIARQRGKDIPRILNQCDGDCSNCDRQN